MAIGAMRDDERTRANDEVLAALERVKAALASAEARAGEIVERGNRLAEQRAAGRSWRAITESEASPHTVDLVRESLDGLQRANSQYRRALTRELYADGVTMEGIAALLGVTRQRVAVLLRRQEEGEEAAEEKD